MPEPTAQRAAAILSWAEQSKLTAMDSATSDAFGGAQDVDIDTAIVGARNADLAALTDAGAAYVYLRTGTTWAQQAKLQAMDAALTDNFGTSVAISGDTAVVGAPLANLAAADAGAAYVFVRSGTTWMQQQKITAMDAALSDQFGYSVAIDGNRIVVGAPLADPGGVANAGAIYVFDRSGTTWTQKAKITATDRANGDRFGWAVTIEGAIIAVGASLANPAGKTDAGAGYIYEDVSGTFNETKVTASDGLGMDAFGTAVTLSSGTAIFGAPSADVGGKSDAGAAYAYVRSAVGTWIEQAKLVTPAAEAVAADSFGISVASFNNFAVVGATGSDPGAKSGAGAAYVYLRNGTTWSQTHKFVASDGAASDGFGLVAMSRNTVVVGAPTADLAGKADAGASYVFASSLQNGDACANGFECASKNCIDGVCCDTTCGGGSPTDCQSCLKAQTGLPADGACGTVTMAAAYVCRTPLGLCDLAEVCDGVATTCPTDRLATLGAVCRQAVSPCDVAETCDGGTSVCPMDRFAVAGTVCRPSIGPCDVAESCDGLGATCPANVVRPMGTMCRPISGVCDEAETCDGVASACPVDKLKPAGFICLAAGADATCDPADTCDGARRTCGARYASRDTACAGGLLCNGRGRCGP